MADLKILPDMLSELRESGGRDVLLSPGWGQGRATYGGVSTALALTSMQALLAEPLPVRSLLVSFVAPIAPGPVSLTPRILRQGKNVTQMSVELSSEGQVGLLVCASFGAARPGVMVEPDAVFQPEPRESVPLLDESFRRLPKFIHQFDVHWTGGGVPFSDKKDRRHSMWARHKADMSAFPAEKLIAIADMPPPIIMSHYDRPVMGSSLTWSLEFVRPPAEIDTDWFYLDYQLDSAADGYSQQSGYVFDEAGRLCVQSRQCMVYFE